MHAIFWHQFIPFIPEFLSYIGVLSNYSRVWVGNLKRFHKDGKRLARNKGFCGNELGRNGVCKRQVTLYLQFSMAQRAKIALSRPPVSLKVVENG